MGIRSAIIILSIFFSTPHLLRAQSDSSYSHKNKVSFREIQKPTIAIGTGMITFVGDISSNSLNSPLANKFSYNLSFSKPINSFLDLNLYVLFGRLTANERTDYRNLNLQSDIKSAGFYLSYNFNHFLNKQRIIEPYILIGLENFEFLSKSDMYDANGSRYNYWTDGSIRNIDQKNPNSKDAIIIRRDYTYETDIREANIDGLGKYKESSFAIPLGIGAKLKLSDQVTFKLGQTIHLSFTDLIDGVTANSLNNRKGNKRNDNFLITSFSLSYDLVIKNKLLNEIEDVDDEYKNIDFLAIYNDDEDNDGVRDFIDKCPGTPSSVKVDKFGCPIDDDLDGVPNHKDEELETTKDAIVMTNGIELTDELIEQMYRAYLGYIEPLEHTLAVKPKKDIIYSVEIGVYKDGKISEDVMNQILNLPDLSSVALQDKNIAYITGEFKNPANAEKTKKMLIDLGLKDAKVVEIKKTNNGTKIIEIEKPAVAVNKKKEVKQNIKTDTKTEEYKNYAAEILNTNKTETVTSAVSTNEEYRVMLGAYTKGIPPNLINKFLKIPEIKPEKINDSITVYSIGKYNNDLERAIYKKTEMLNSGIQDAVLVKYKNGKYIPVTQEEMDISTQKAGISKIPSKYTSSLNKPIGSEDLDIKQYADESFTKFDPKNTIVFRVQLGAYKKRLSQNIFKGISGVLELTTEQKLTKYLSGSYTNYYDAASHKVDMVMKGFEDAFIVAYKNGDRVSLNSVGAHNVTNENLNENRVINTINKSLISYKIEIGTYKGDLPAEVIKKLGPLALELEKKVTMEGTKRYTIGDFKDYMSALIYKNQMSKKYGMPEIKITSFFKDEIIPIQEALDLTE